MKQRSLAPPPDPSYHAAKFVQPKYSQFTAMIQPADLPRVSGVLTPNRPLADLEQLGELVRKKVFQTSNIELQWEVIRVGEHEVEQT